MTRIVLFGLVILMAQTASAQGERLEAHVSHMTTEYVYLDVGSNQGLHNADTLAVFRRGVHLGELRVQGVSRSRSVNRMLAAAFDLSIGDTLWVVLPDGASPVEATASTPDVRERQSLMTASQSVTAPTGRRKRPPLLSGRIRLGTSILRTKWETSTPQSVIRTFATPTISGRLVGRGLPGGITAIMRFRVSRRLSSGSTISPTTLTRFQQLSLLRALPGSPFELETGRFQFREDPGRTYWDGARASWKGNSLEWGVAVGFEPDRFNGQVQTSVPKVGSFVRNSVRVGELRSSTTLSGVMVRPNNQWVDHTYAGLRQDFRYGRFRWNSEVQLDQDPEGGVYASRIQSSVRLPLAKGFELRPRISIRKPFSAWRSSNVVGTQRTQTSVALGWSGRGASANLTWTETVAAAGFRGTSYAGGYSMADVGLAGIGTAVSAGVWSGAGSSTRYGTVSLTRRLRGLRGRATYQVYQVDGRTARTQSHSIMFGVAGNLGRYFDLSAQVRRQFSSQTSSNSLFLSLGYRF